MQSFLNKVALTTLEKYGKQLGEVTIVLPNRRAIVFLKEEFRKQMTSGGWLPEFFSLEDFVTQLGNYEIPDQVDLMVQLYQVHREIEGKSAEPFEEFLSWGTTLLQDFNEIDRYLIDGEELFSFLTEAKAIETWNLNEAGLTEFQENYLKFWRKLGKYYRLFREKLLEQNFAYQGLAFREVAENKTFLKEFGPLIFAGFNALTEAEKVIIRYYEDQYDALILWDADEYYLNDSFQEAGKFLRDYKKQSKKGFNWISRHLLEDSKKVDIYGISGNVGQGKLVGNLINTGLFQNTAVILSDEELLVPVLESLPEQVDRANVTMGYPISLSPVFSWIKTYLQLLLNNQQDEKINSFYYKELKAFLEHSVSKHLSEQLSQAFQKVIRNIEQEKLIFISPGLLKGIDTIFSQPVFSAPEMDGSTLIGNLLVLIKELQKTAGNTLDKLNKECLFEIEKVVNRLKILQENSAFLNLESIYEIFQQMVSRQSISFIGEPLGGLQIMGVLESRTLDFKNVIISSVNEGVLPSGKSHNSFIPFDIKRKFSLPSYQEKDAIFAYHFYRILQRAEHISILYNTKTDQLQGGERSRFIEQVIYELPRKNKNISLSEHVISPDSRATHHLSTTIQLTESIRNRMKNHLQTGISPSALNTFLSCPLDYYYKYLIGLKENNAPEEKIEDNTLGTLVHNALENIYTPYINRVLDIKAIQEAKKQVDSELKLQFKKELNTSPDFGNHKLTFEVARQFTLALLQYDEADIKNGNEIILDSLESDLRTNCMVELTDGSAIDILLKGKIDRTDIRNGKKRIIDYKTGSTERSDLNWYNNDIILAGKKSKAVQLLFYQYGFLLQNEPDVTAGIISLRKISNGFMSLNSKNNHEETMETILSEALSSMLLSDFIRHNEDAKYCNFCK